MKNVNIRLTLDRHASNGTTTLKGSVNKQDVDLTVRRGTEDATAYVTGDWAGHDNVDLSFNRDVSEGYNGIEGEWKGRYVNVDLEREVDGDTTARTGARRYEIDRDQKGEIVDYRGTEPRGRVRRELRDGDERGTLTMNGEQISFRVDRDTRTGDFEVTGRSSDGRFRMEAERTRSDGDLEISGTLPDGMTMFPLLWEVLGDDKNIPDNNPLYPSSLLGMGMFVDGDR